MRILVVCTGNICRSPIAEAILRDRLARRGVDAEVSSAGLLEEGRPASEHSVAVLAARGVVLAGHRSRRATAELVRHSDLVLGMARRHVQEAVVLVPDAFARAFTLKEIVRRGEQAGPRRAGERVDEWLERVAAGRTPAELLGADPDDDIVDPIGRPRAVYEQVAAEIEDHVDRLVALLFAT